MFPYIKKCVLGAGVAARWDEDAVFARYEKQELRKQNYKNLKNPQ